MPKCPSGYTELVSSSDDCYKIVEHTIDGNKMTWERARDNCKDDKAMLACFSTQNQRDELSQICEYVEDGKRHGCWVGYQYVDGSLI